MLIQIAIYLILALFIILVELRRDKEILFDMMTFFNFFFLIVYSLIPTILLIGGVKEYANANLYRGVFYFGKHISTPLIVFLAYLSFLGGYYWSYPRNLVNLLHFDFKLNEDNIIKIFPFSRLRHINITTFEYKDDFISHGKTEIVEKYIGVTSKQIANKIS